MLDIAAWLGRFVARLHAIPLNAQEREDGWRAFGEELRWRHANARTGRDADLPHRLLAEAFDWLPPLEAMLPAPEQLVLTHADLKDEHLFGASSAETFTPAAAIDFGEARLAHPMYDLPVVWWSALGGDRDLLATFLEHAAIPGVDVPDFPRMALAWAMVHPSWDVVRLGDLEGVADLDALAWRLFGGLAAERE
jgi:aminoglycoside phosphotransferase (APT) family kinase protein